GVPERRCERSEAIQFAPQRKNGLLRRFAPRNDERLCLGCLKIEMTSARAILVIPGRAKREPGIHTPYRGYGFRAQPCGPPRNDEWSNCPRVSLLLWSARRCRRDPLV